MRKRLSAACHRRAVPLSAFLLHDAGQRWLPGRHLFFLAERCDATDVPGNAHLHAGCDHRGESLGGEEEMVVEVWRKVATIAIEKALRTPPGYDRGPGDALDGQERIVRFKQ